MQQLTQRLSEQIGRLGPNSYKVVAAFSLRVAAAGLGFALSWTLARLYGPEGLGTYSVGVTTATFGAYLALIGQDYVILRSVAGELKVGKKAAARGIVRTSATVAAGAATLGALIMAGIGLLLGERMGSQGSADMLVLVAPAVLGLAMGRAASWALRGAGLVIVSQVLEGVITPALILLAVLGALVFGGLLPLWSIGALYVGAAFASAGLGWLCWRRLSRSWPPAERMAPAALLVSGVPMLIASASSAASDWGALFATDLFTGAAAAGQLRVALQLMMAVTLLSSSFDVIIGPQIAAAWKVGDLKRLRSVFRKATIGLTIATAPILIGGIVFADWLMGLFGDGFEDGARALQILALGQLLTIPAGPMGTVMIMSGHDKTLIWYSLASLVVIFALCVIVVPIYGVTGGALVVAGNMMFRRAAAQITLRYVAKLKLNVWRRAPQDS